MYDRLAGNDVTGTAASLAGRDVTSPVSIAGACITAIEAPRLAAAALVGISPRSAVLPRSLSSPRGDVSGDLGWRELAAVEHDLVERTVELVRISLDEVAEHERRVHVELRVRNRFL